ncbi:MAG: hypothetical protein KJI69_05205 [Patescibacteria group bacterium]|nr:hypothetical protein [Patescibacteria group bacterium]
MVRKIWKKPKRTEREYLYWLVMAIHHQAEEEASGKLGYKNNSAVNVLNCLSTHSIFKIIRLTLTEMNNKDRVLYEDEKDKIIPEE